MVHHGVIKLYRKEKIVYLARDKNFRLTDQIQKMNYRSKEKSSLESPIEIMVICCLKN